MMQLLLKSVECLEHPEVRYDPRGDGKCPECEEDKIKEVEDALDRKERQMVWE
jgi:hypothetical protein